MSPEKELEYRFLAAAENGNIHRLQELLEQGCSVNAQNKESYLHRVPFQHSSLSDMARFLAHCTFS